MILINVKALTDEETKSEGLYLTSQDKLLCTYD